MLTWRSFRAAVRVTMVTAGAVAAIATIGCSSGEEWGLADTAPLGTQAAFDASLAKRSPTKEEWTPEQVKNHIGNNYPELEFALTHSGVKYSLGDEWILALQNERGKIVAVVSQFRSGALHFGTVGKPIDAFVSRYWKALSGGDAEFQEMELDVRYDGKYLAAAFGSAVKGGKWRKDATGGNLGLRTSITDRVWFWKQ